MLAVEGPVAGAGVPDGRSWGLRVSKVLTSRDGTVVPENVKNICDQHEWVSRRARSKGSSNYAVHSLEPYVRKNGHMVSR